MADRPLPPEDDALWAKVAATVRPIDRRRRIASAPPPAMVAPALPAADPVPRIPRPRARPGGPGETLDAGWDRRLKQGVVAPDLTIDLHEHTLAGAHAALDAGLARAVASRARLVVLVAGRPPRPGTSRLDTPLRGIIRASVRDWLHASPHAGAIAAIRAAHPRHGGAGALYLVMRRIRA